MDRLLFVVARDQPKLFDYVKRAFGDTPKEVEVVLDRRVGERRRQARGPNGERRRAERRQDCLDGRLRDLGWAVIKRRPA